MRGAMLCAMTAAAPLIIVRDLHEVVDAGYGNATASVRTLDGVSLAIHPGELLLVDSAVAGGAQALCSALAAPRRSLTGDREVRVGVRIRRATISLAARDVIVRTWMEESARRVRFDTDADGQTTARVVYLLRVRAACVGPRAPHGTVTRESATHGSASPNAWRDWASALRASQGAVVLFSTAPASGSFHPRATSAGNRTTGAVHEPDHSTPRGRVRALRMSAGRVVSEQLISVAPVTPASTYRGNDVSRLPKASIRCSTGSTAPSSRGDAELR